MALCITGICGSNENKNINNANWWQGQFKCWSHAAWPWLGWQMMGMGTMGQRDDERQWDDRHGIGTIFFVRLWTTIILQIPTTLLQIPTTLLQIPTILLQKYYGSTTSTTSLQTCSTLHVTTRYYIHYRFRGKLTKFADGTCSRVMTPDFSNSRI